MENVIDKELYEASCELHYKRNMLSKLHYALCSLDSAMYVAFRKRFSCGPLELSLNEVQEAYDFCSVFANALWQKTL